MIWEEYSNFKDKGDLEDSGILIVDDDNNNLELLRHFFRVEGFGVTSASNADEALALLKVSRFSFLLTDYIMPGKNGLELAEEALGILPDLKIIMITGNSSAQLSNRAATSGIRDVLVKPINFKDLSRIMVAENTQTITNVVPAT